MEYSLGYEDPDYAEEQRYEYAMENFEYDRALTISNFPFQCPQEYREAFIGIFLCAYDCDNPDAVRIANEAKFNEEDIALLSNDYQKYFEIQERYKSWGDDE